MGNDESCQFKSGDAVITTVEPPLMATLCNNPQQPLLVLPAKGPQIHSYFNLSTSVTLPQWQPPLNCIPTAKLAYNNQRTDSQGLIMVFTTV